MASYRKHIVIESLTGITFGFVCYWTYGINLIQAIAVATVAEIGSILPDRSVNLDGIKNDTELFFANPQELEKNIPLSHPSFMPNGMNYIIDSAFNITCIF